MKRLEFIMKESDPIPLPDQPTLFGKFAQIIQEKDAKIDQLNEQLAKVHHQLKLATDKEVCHLQICLSSKAEGTESQNGDNLTGCLHINCENSRVREASA